MGGCIIRMSRLQYSWNNTPSGQESLVKCSGTERPFVHSVSGMSTVTRRTTMKHPDIVNLNLGAQQTESSRRICTDLQASAKSSTIERSLAPVDDPSLGQIKLPEEIGLSSDHAANTTFSNNDDISFDKTAFGEVTEPDNKIGNEAFRMADFENHSSVPQKSEDDQVHDRKMGDSPNGPTAVTKLAERRSSASKPLLPSNLSRNLFSMTSDEGKIMSHEPSQTSSKQSFSNESAGLELQSVGKIYQSTPQMDILRSRLVGYSLN
ncbi:unnamed protein product [Protopolystoma xenopodis]|uniref:Uncharacterized protein n=1 Tax=Protopolystoma xenopodis TaxID=117903 RepID=A0A448WHC1_9PLAT|nr:unnamed protein product [Protopolystoma xenopodis]